jgi:purine-nucleoside phosphorylase
MNAPELPNAEFSCHAPPVTRHFPLETACREAPPEVVLVLGSGMGPVTSRVRRLLSVPFAEVPGLPAASVVGHAGCLTLGEWAGRRVLVFEGRLHYYEGHSWDVVVRPIQIAAELGVKYAVLTNAAGGIGDPLGPGSLMAITDHIEITRPFFWRHPGPGGLGPARPSPYAPGLRELLARAATTTGIKLHQGIYAAVTGPCYETPAEIRALRTWGADAVGMSTAREIQAGAEAGLECAAISCITNRAAGLSATPLNHEEVLTMAAAQSTRLAQLLEEWMRLLPWGEAEEQRLH